MSIGLHSRSHSTGLILQESRFLGSHTGLYFSSLGDKNKFNLEISVKIMIKNGLFRPIIFLIQLQNGPTSMKYISLEGVRQ